MTKEARTILVATISILCAALLLFIALAHYPVSGFDWTMTGPGGYCFGIRAGAPVLSVWLPLAYHTELCLGPITVTFNCRAPFVPVWLIAIGAFFVGAKRLYRAASTRT